MVSDPSDVTGFDAPTVHRRRVLRAAAGLGTAAVAGAETSGAVRAQESAAGAERWQFDVPLDAFSSPTVVDGTLFVGCWYDEGDGETGGRLVALDAGVDGSSEGSRVMLGTLGHHGGWRYADQTIDAVTPAEPATDSPTGTASETATGTSADDADPIDADQGDGAQTDAVWPGFAPASALAGLGGAAALLGRRFADDERDAE